MANHSKNDDPYIKCLIMDLKELGLDAETMLQKYKDIIEELREHFDAQNLAEEIKIAEHKNLTPEKWLERISLAKEAESDSLGNFRDNDFEDKGNKVELEEARRIVDSAFEQGNQIVVFNENIQVELEIVKNDDEGTRTYKKYINQRVQ